MEAEDIGGMAIRLCQPVKAGDKEVRYEADREAVEAQLEQIVGLIFREEPADVQVGLTGEPPEALAPSPTAPAKATEPAAAVPVAVSEARKLERLYAVGKGRRLRLRKLPERTADTLVLVLYGMLKLQDRSWVHAPGMTSAARASGARFDRADRLLAGYQDLIEGVGNRRAKRYRLTAAGREHCARLVDALVDPIDTEGSMVAGEPIASEPEPAEADDSGIPKRVTDKWDGEVLTVAEAAGRLGVDEAEIGRLRRGWQLLGLPAGDSKRRRFFYPAFQIDAERREIYPQAREANRIVGGTQNSWDIAKWWNTVDPELGARPRSLIGTPDAGAAVRRARARFDPAGLS